METLVEPEGDPRSGVSSGARPAEPVRLTGDAVRRAVVAAQRIPTPRPSGAGFGVGSGAALGADAETAGETAGDAAQVLRTVGLLQLDPLMRVSTAQRLTSLTRLPRGHRADAVDAELWPRGAPASFETFTKVACLFPLEDWPLLRVHRERHLRRRREQVEQPLAERIRRVVEAAGSGVPIGTIETEAGAGERTTGWNWTRVKVAAEQMVRSGELVITARDGTTRLFDLPERGLPEHVLAAADLDDDALLAGLARRAAASLAVMTQADFAHHYHLRPQEAADGLAAAGLAPVEVAGWRELGWCVPELLAEGGLLDPAAPAAGDGAAGDDVDVGARRRFGAPSHARLVGPFDPLLRDRGRARRIFDFEYRFEAYVPPAQRLYGHYVMAVLSGDRLIGRVDLRRVGETLRVEQIFGERGVPRRVLRPRVRGAGRTLARQLGVELVLPEG
ncbi:DNA glycosylase AlkZ-like family protein [Nesterenkonia halobia]|uniref:Crosslink repair DNA glycosylase YcaQ family protein n=1 Tax=Nesterenkonia halobia TaxID=37922 RepID=A0ABP6RB42_9MICC